MIGVISLDDTAYVLREALGSIRSWHGWLTASTHKKQHVKGFSLTPCASLHDGKGYRP